MKWYNFTVALCAKSNEDFTSEMGIVQERVLTIFGSRGYFNSWIFSWFRNDELEMAQNRLR